MAFNAFVSAFGMSSNCTYWEITALTFPTIPPSHMPHRARDPRDLPWTGPDSNVPNIFSSRIYTI